MKIGIDCGHCLSGADTGAQGQGFKEELKTRDIGNSLMNLLKANNIDFVNCTIDYAASVNDSLSERVQAANNSKVDLFVSIHLNAADGAGNGVETYVYNYALKTSLNYADNIQKELVKLGYRDRGVKSDNLYVLKYTTSPAVLVECGFIDNSKDMQLYNPDQIARAIFTGITGIVLNYNQCIFTSSDNWVARLQNECNRQGFSNQIVDGIAGSITLAGCPTLKFGSKGNITRLMQERLNDLGYSCGGIDGIFGNNTLKAITTYQLNNNLYVDGIVGQNTWRKLLGL